MRCLPIILALALAPLTQAQPVSHPSNVLFIMLDDWGVDSSPIDNPQGKDLPDMPNLVKLAQSSIRFENGYAMPSCSPTRNAIMTGRLPSSTGVGSPGRLASRRDASSMMSIAEAMDQAKVKHVSGLFGKWHLGYESRGPAADGWDAFYGSISGNMGRDDGAFYNWARENIQEERINRAGKDENETTYATVVTTDDAIDFVKKHDHWLCWVAYNAPHSPLDPPPTTLNGKSYSVTQDQLEKASDREKYKAKLWAVDNEVGRLLDNVDLQKTTVILIGDNGTARKVLRDKNLFSDGKGSIHDGGVHVTFVVRPPGGVKARVETAPVGCTDLFPTFCDLMGIDSATLGQDLDGQSILPIIRGQRDARYVVAEVFGGRQESNDGRTIRKGNYKLNIFQDPTEEDEVGKVEFFDLSDGWDESARNNLLRAGYEMTQEQQAAYNDLVSHNKKLNAEHKYDYNVPE